MDSKSNIAKFVEIPFQLLTPASARNKFAELLRVLPCGASDMPCKLLTAGIDDFDLYEIYSNA